MIGAQRVDFVSIPVTDKERAMQFYGETLGLERDPKSSADWPEYSLGNVTISLVFPDRIGWPMVNTPPGAIAIRVPDVADARSKLEGAGSSSRATRSTAASATWPSSRTRTGTG